VSAVSDYEMSNEDYSFTVNGDGLIDGKETEEIKVTNRIIRISVGIKDKLFRGQVSDVNIAIHDAEDNTVKVWDSTGLEQTIEGLTPGEYMVIINGNKDQAQKIRVEDKTELQAFSFEQWTVADIGAIIGVSFVVIGMIVILVIVGKRRRQRKIEDKE